MPELGAKPVELFFYAGEGATGFVALRLHLGGAFFGVYPGAIVAFAAQVFEELGEGLVDLMRFVLAEKLAETAQAPSL